MKELRGGCRVYSPQDGQIETHGTWRARSVISRASGAKHITQTLSEYAPGRSPFVTNPSAEEVLYVISGHGACNINNGTYSLQPGVALFIPPGATYNIENNGTEPIHTVTSCCPEDPERTVRPLEQPPASAVPGAHHLSVHEKDRTDVRAGADRLFRILVHTDLGCRQVTQFVGWIPTSKAPVHYHEYEEGIFILQGNGIVHTEDDECEFGPGSSVYFPQGVRHCVENPGNTTIKLLGAFYPSGSPGAAYEDH